MARPQGPHLGTVRLDQSTFQLEHLGLTNAGDSWLLGSRGCFTGAPLPGEGKSKPQTRGLLWQTKGHTLFSRVFQFS